MKETRPGSPTSPTELVVQANVKQAEGSRPRQEWSCEVDRLAFILSTPARGLGRVGRLAVSWKTSAKKEATGVTCRRGWTEAASRWQVRRVSISYESTPGSESRRGGSRERHE